MKSFTWQRAVLKIGSSLVAPDGRRCSAQYLLTIAQFITQSRLQGKEIIIVSSGSVAAGRYAIKSGLRASIAEKQAMASIGQMQMMANWTRFFDGPCAQVLLTIDDLNNRKRYVNIKNTLRELLANSVLPIVNENDTVATSELKVGDNDNLAAHTAIAAQADTLIICSDIDGLFTSDPRRNKDATLIDIIHSIDQSIYDLAGGAGTVLGTGGMRTKIQAADKCAKSGVQTLIVNGTNSRVFEHLLEGQCNGTLFIPSASSARAKHHWLAHTLVSKGTIHIDAGAYQALIHTGSSLLPSGIIKSTGEFDAGDALDIYFEQQLVAKGLSLYPHYDMQKIIGLHSKCIDQTLGYSVGVEAIHRDDLVILHASSL